MSRKTRAVVQKGQYLEQPPEYRVIYAGVGGKVRSSRFFKTKAKAQALARKMNAKE